MPDRLFSSSAITKRFAVNSLIGRGPGHHVEDHYLPASGVPSHLASHPYLWPCGPYVDQSRRLITMMRRLPFLPLPAHNRLRQPICKRLARGFGVGATVHDQWLGSSLPQRIAPVAMAPLRYDAMLRALQQSFIQIRYAVAVFCPCPISFLRCGVSSFLGPQAFEAVLRMGSDLSDYTGLSALNASHSLSPTPCTDHCCTSLLPLLERLPLGYSACPYPHLSTFVEPNTRSSHHCPTPRGEASFLLYFHQFLPTMRF